MANRQSDTKTTMQVRLDIGLHKLLKVESAKQGITTKELLDDIVSEWVGREKINEQ